MAASNGSIQISTKNKVYNIDTYTPDAVATYWGFSPSGLAGAGSPTQLVIPDDGFITGYTQVAAPTAVGATITLDSAPVSGGTLRFANQLSTLATRGAIMIPVRRGQILSALQF